jgi:hypothetical protein
MPIAGKPMPKVHGFTLHKLKAWTHSALACDAFGRLT